MVASTGSPFLVLSWYLVLQISVEAGCISILSTACTNFWTLAFMSSSYFFLNPMKGTTSWRRNPNILWLVVGEKIATSRYGDADSKVACACETQIIKSFETDLQASNAFSLLLVYDWEVR